MDKKEQKFNLIQGVFRRDFNIYKTIRGEETLNVVK